jgi:CubicO group peptidase (beta-lactamase class C family)
MLVAVAPLHTAVAVARHGRIAVAETNAALYDIGSAGKTFTAAAVLELVRSGRLRLDERLVQALPGVPRDKRTITIRELLTHTSGLPAYLGPDREALGAAAALRRILALPVRHRGSFVYSDAGYTLLAELVQHVSGMPFERYVRLRLFTPAGLRATTFADGRPLPGHPLAHGFVRGVDRGPAGTQVPLSWSILGAGGIVSTAGDLVRWVEWLQRTGLARTMWRGQGLGWVVGPHGIAVGGGTDFGYTSDIRVYPRTDTITVVLSATDAAPAPEIARRLAPS